MGAINKHFLMRDHLGEFGCNDETRRGARAPIPYHRSGGSSIERRVYLNGVKVFRIFRNEFSRSGARRIENPYPILTGPARGAKAQVLNLRVIQRSQISYCKKLLSAHAPLARTTRFAWASLERGSGVRALRHSEYRE